VPFAERVIKRAIELDAELIIEKNHGGAWLGATFMQVMRQMGQSCKYRMIHASHAKRTRAEPVSALYAEHGGRVLHVHPEGRLDPHLSELEDQMATFTGAAGERSPDRLDSLVWACTPFLRRTFGPPGPHGVRQWAAQRELEQAGSPPNHLALRRLASAHGGHLARLAQGWDLDSFSPQDSADGWDVSDITVGLDGSEHADYTDGRPWGGRPGRSNVRLWR
jgi:phage terminase large subunit-like protein